MSLDLVLIQVLAQHAVSVRHAVGEVDFTEAFRELVREAHLEKTIWRDFICVEVLRVSDVEAGAFPLGQVLRF